MQQRRDDAVLVQPHLRADLRGGDAVRHIRRTRLALLPAVGAVGKLKGGADSAEIDAGVVLQDRVGKLAVALFNNFFSHSFAVLLLPFGGAAQIGDHQLNAASAVKVVNLRHEYDVAFLPGSCAERGRGLGKEHAVVGLGEL